jgi:hypothetical protein
MLSLARALARSCHRPGRYAILLVVPDKPGEPLRVDIGRVERLRR